jgi:septal ring factor EnvC (AmiA/AmiB activator)
MNESREKRKLLMQKRDKMDALFKLQALKHKALFATDSEKEADKIDKEMKANEKEMAKLDKEMRKLQKEIKKGGLMAETLAEKIIKNQIKEASAKDISMGNFASIDISSGLDDLIEDGMVDAKDEKMVKAAVEKAISKAKDAFDKELKKLLK